MRADRVLSLLLLLQNRGRMTAPELAAELEVSVRTVYRDIEALGASGVPVRADRGPSGGFRLMDGYRTRLTGLTGDEAGSLFLSGVPGPARELGLGALLTTAQRKVRAALPAGPAEHSTRVQERFHLDPTGWFREPDDVPYLTLVARAVWEGHALRTHYRRWSGEVHRTLHPLGVVLKGGIWYLVADRAHAGEAGPGPEPEPGAEPEAGGAVRTYRVSRFLSVEATDRTFARPAGFDLAAYWAASAQRLETAFHQDTALLRLSPDGQRLLPAKFGAHGVRALAEAGPPDRAGRVRVELRVEPLQVAVHDLLGLGETAEVLGPRPLREAMARTAAALAARYGPPDPTKTATPSRVRAKANSKSVSRSRSKSSSSSINEDSTG